MDLKHSDSSDNAGGNNIFIRGLVIPAEWDETGKVVAVSVAAFDDKKYLVAENQAAKDLLNFVEHEVAVIGTLQTVGSRVFLTISDFFGFGSKSD